MVGRDDGFTLIELMVVVLIIAILLAIAIPTFLGARDRANDRAAQSNLRNANTNALVYYADGHQSFTQDPATMEALDPSLRYTNTKSLATSKTVYIEVVTTYSPSDTVYLATQSTNGPCFWIRTIGDESEPRFSSVAGACSLADPSSLAWTDEW